MPRSGLVGPYVSSFLAFLGSFIHTLTAAAPVCNPTPQWINVPSPHPCQCLLSFKIFSVVLTEVGWNLMQLQFAVSRCLRKYNIFKPFYVLGHLHFFFWGLCLITCPLLIELFVFLVFKFCLFFLFVYSRHHLSFICLFHSVGNLFTQMMEFFAI